MESYYFPVEKSIAFSSGMEGVASPLKGGAPPPVFGASLGSTYETTQPPPLINFQKLSQWSLLAASRTILLNDNRYQYRVCSCCRVVLIPKAGVDIFERVKKFHYKGLGVCGSVWLCPVCAARVSLDRRVELALAVERIGELGGSAQLWTFTAPHNLGQSLKFLSGALTDARRRMLNRKSYKAQISSLDVLGTVRGLEVTHTKNNGWHVHFHVLGFMSRKGSEYNLKDIEDIFSELWLSACVDSGLGAPSRAHGVTVKNGSAAGKYIGKWGVEDEMTKWHVKKGKGKKGLTPFDFLRAHAAGDFQHDDLFREYARQFSGKAQLDWSPGLRDRLGMDSLVSDSKIAGEVVAGSIFFANIPSEVWRIILKDELRGEVLAVCKNGLQALVDYIKKLSGIDIEESMNPMVRALYRGGV